MNSTIGVEQRQMFSFSQLQDYPNKQNLDLFMIFGSLFLHGICLRRGGLMKQNL